MNKKWSAYFSAGSAGGRFASISGGYHMYNRGALHEIEVHRKRNSRDIYSLGRRC